MLNKLEITTDELRLGMYVVELDRPWIGTAFAFQGFPLTSDDQIAQLKSCCKVVYVDPERDSWSPEKRLAAQPLPAAGASMRALPIEQELPVAKRIYSSCEDALEALLAGIRSRSGVEGDAVTAAVANMVDSIQRSADAMLLLNALRRRDSLELTRAMDTSLLMVTFGRFLDFPRERLELLGVAGMLLDVGLAELPADLVAAFHSNAAVDSGLIEMHVLHSMELVRAARGLPPRVDEVVALHHERQDGEGYPHGLKGDQISGDGAIAAIVDAYSRLMTSRSQSAQLSPSAALSALHKQRGQAFHERLVDQFIQCIGVYPVGAAVELNTGELGIVIAQNPTRRLLPRVSVMTDEHGARITTQKILDLSRTRTTGGDEPLRIRRTLPKHELALEAAEFLL